jgi:RimJ/RimL family protein N-acetyltransferase
LIGGDVVMKYYEDIEIMIRDIKKEDAASLFTWWVDKELNKYDPRPLPSNSEELLKECISFCKRFDTEIINDNEKARRYKYFIIADKNDYPIGAVNFFSIDMEKRQGEMGVLIGDKRYWRKGIASKAVNAAVEYIFNNMSIDRIYIETGENNLPAIKLFTKTGFVRCGEYLEDDGFKFIIMEKVR